MKLGQGVLMYRKIVQNDVVKNKWMSLILILFIAAAAMLVSLASMLTIHLSSSIDVLMSKAKTPHFLQMHTGNLDSQRLEQFAKSQAEVDQYQVLEFLQIDNTGIMMGGKLLADSVQDHGFVTQSKQFDFLLNLDGEVIHAKDGEIYVPVNYMKDNSAQIGESIVVNGRSFSIAGFLRDSQMNSLLASSKRFLISENDYAQLKTQAEGKLQYLIEFRLTDLSQVGSFQTAYTTEGLEANGPTLTYSLFKMLNAISDGLMIAVILLVSLLVVIIAMMCIRFTLLAKMEDEYRDIGVMKAIGFRAASIKKIYLIPYAVMAAIGCMLGFIISYLCKGLLLQNIRLYMGEVEDSIFSLVIGLVGILIIFVLVTVYVNIVLRRFRQISATEALRYGAAQGTGAGSKRFNLSSNKWLNTNLFLGFKDVLLRKKMYITMLIVLMMSTFIMLVPHHLYHTISSDNFIRYMGIGKSDLRIDIPQGDQTRSQEMQLEQMLRNDSDIQKYAVFHTKSFMIKRENGSEQLIKIELGNHHIFPLSYSEGGAPKLENEIALSLLLSQELGKKVGDSMTIKQQGGFKPFTVSGIYSDITNGGKTAKATFTDESANTIWSIMYAKLEDSAPVAHKVKQYSDKFHFAKMTGIDDFKAQTFGSTISSIKLASYVAAGIALILTMLITLLFTKMLVAKDKFSIGVMKALGFRNDDVMKQYFSRSILVALIALILGIFLANYVGAFVVGGILSSFGASSFQFEVSPFIAYVISPLLLIIAVFIATLLGASDVNKIKIYENIKE